MPLFSSQQVEMEQHCQMMILKKKKMKLRNQYCNHCIVAQYLVFHFLKTQQSGSRKQKRKYDMLGIQL